MEKITYTADEEIPCCVKCDNMDMEEEHCKKYCGASHGWSRYERNEFVDKE